MKNEISVTDKKAEFEPLTEVVHKFIYVSKFGLTFIA